MNRMKKGISFLTALACLAAPALAAAESQPQAAQRANIKGVVQDAYGDPVSGARIEAIREGVVVATVTTTSAGGYEFTCLDQGRYELRLEGEKSYQGHGVIAPLDERGLSVTWAVDKAKPALASATATGGLCADAVVQRDAITDETVARGVAGEQGATGTAGVAGTAGASSSVVPLVAAGVVVGTGGVVAGLAASGTFKSDDKPKTSAE